MQILAIRSDNGKGIHLIEDDKAKNAILKRYEGCSHRIFKENEREVAMKWAGVNSYTEKDIAKQNKQQQQKTLEKKIDNHPFITALDDFRKDGYAYAVIKLSNNASYNIWLGNCYFLKARRKLYSLDVHSGWYESEKIVPNFVEFNTGYGDRREYMPFSDFKEKADAIIKNFLEKHSNYNYEQVLYAILSYSADMCTFSRGIFSFVEKPEIKVYGNFIKISSLFKTADFRIDSNQEGVCEDMMINFDNIVNIIPKKEDRDVFANKYIKVFNKLIEDGVVDKNGQFVKTK